MAFKHFLSLLLTHNLLLYCGSAAVHSHSVDTQERESDGSFRQRDFDHYGDSGHNPDFDHEAILGSVKEAEEYDRLTPEEAKERLSTLLLPKMDLNGDKQIDRTELKKWILESFHTVDVKDIIRKLSLEETKERMQDADENADGILTWAEYLRDSFGVDFEEELSANEIGDNGMLVHEEQAMWKTADKNGDGNLDLTELLVFTNPEEHPEMHGFLLNSTLREKDLNKDGMIDFNEFLGNRANQQDKSWLISEKDKFDHDLDLNGDGSLDISEIRAWVIPDNNEIAEEEVDHLFASADDNHDDYLSFEEILNNHDVFVGSEGHDYGNDILGEHFDDEL